MSETVADTLEQRQTVELLTRCWMTHDGMWFAQVLEECGPETASRLNLGAIRAMAPIELKRLLKAWGRDSVTNHDELRAFLEFAMALFIGDFFATTWDWQPDGSVTVEIERCFAHDGITALGGIASYQCGIYERILAWLRGLGLEFEISPAVEGCMMHSKGHCRHLIRVDYGGG